MKTLIAILLCLAMPVMGGVMVINSYRFSSAFTPTNIAGCKLWLAADGAVYNTGTTQATDGQTVATWVDASGQANDATEATNKPTFETNELNGKPVLRFDGTNDKLTTASVFTSGNGTVFIVLGATNLATSPVIFSDIGGNQFAEFTSGGSFYWGGALGGATFRTYSTPTMTSGERGIVTLLLASSTSGELRKNGGTPGSYSGSLTGVTLAYQLIGIYAGGALPIAGDIAEIIVYDTALGTTDRQAVESYLATKYGL